MPLNHQFYKVSFQPFKNQISRSNTFQFGTDAGIPIGFLSDWHDLNAMQKSDEAWNISRSLSLKYDSYENLRIFNLDTSNLSSNYK